jgi:predicted phage tail protein
MSSLIVHNVAPHVTGVATGMNTNIGGVIGTAIVCSFVTCRLRADAVAAESGYTHALTLLAVISVVAIGVALLIPPNTATPAQQSAIAVHPSRKRNG